jgi:hypothetical protein
LNWDGLPSDRDNGQTLNPLRKRNPDAFDRLSFLYHHLLEDFILRISEGRSIFGIGRLLGTQLVEVQANPNDVNDIHRRAMKQYALNQTPENIREILINGRNFALEVMGYLAEAYRAEFLLNVARPVFTGR